MLGLSFYPLEQAPNIMIYAMSKSGTATSGLIYLSGFGLPCIGTDARRCCQKIHLPTSGSKLEGVTCRWGLFLRGAVHD